MFDQVQRSPAPLSWIASPTCPNSSNAPSFVLPPPGLSLLSGFQLGCPSIGKAESASKIQRLKSPCPFPLRIEFNVVFCRGTHVPMHSNVKGRDKKLNLLDKSCPKVDRTPRSPRDKGMCGSRQAIPHAGGEKHCCGRRLSVRQGSSPRGWGKLYWTRSWEDARPGGLLAKLAREALAELKAGRCTPLP